MMIKKKVIIVMALAIAVFIGAEAKKSKVELSLEDYKALESAPEAVKTEYETKIQVLTDSIEKLKDVIDYQKQASIEKNEANPEFKLLKDSIAALKQVVEAQEIEIAELDMVKLRYTNGRLRLPFNQEKIKDAKELFNSIKDPQIKKQYAMIPKLLDQYALEITPAKSLISSLEFQCDKNSLTKFDEDKWRRSKEGALQKIRNNSFYKNSRNQDYKILYLYDIIIEAEQRVNASKEPTDIPSFGDLLFRLNMN